MPSQTWILDLIKYWIFHDFPAPVFHELRSSPPARPGPSTGSGAVASPPIGGLLHRYLGPDRSCGPNGSGGGFDKPMAWRHGTMQEDPRTPTCDMLGCKRRRNHEQKQRIWVCLRNLEKVKALHQKGINYKPIMWENHLKQNGSVGKKKHRTGMRVLGGDISAPVPATRAPPSRVPQKNDQKLPLKTSTSPTVK